MAERTMGPTKVGIDINIGTNERLCNKDVELGMVVLELASHVRAKLEHAGLYGIHIEVKLSSFSEIIELKGATLTWQPLL